MNSRRDDEIAINRIAQGIEPLDRGIQWFHSLTSERQLEILRYTVGMISHAHPREDEIHMATNTVDLKLTCTPLVLLSLKNKPISERLGKIVQLPKEEYSKSFRVLLRILSISDGRRRNMSCKGSCTHWWHQDLTSPDVTARLRNYQD